jgi:hypothetical protein
MIEFFSPEDLSHIAMILAERREEEAKLSAEAVASVEEVRSEAEGGSAPVGDLVINSSDVSDDVQVVNSTPVEAAESDTDLYSISSFTV